jgi:hypothetical protein
MRGTLLGVVAACLLAAGCVTVTAQAPSIVLPTLPVVPTLPGIPTLPPVPTLPGGSGAPASNGTATLPPAATSTPGSGTPTVVVKFDHGPNAGTFTATGDPQCNYNVIGDDTWGAQFGDLSAAEGQLSTVQITDAPDTSGNGKERIVSAFIVVGPIFGGTSYTLSLDRFSGDFTREIQDNGQSATIHIAGKSLETPLGPGGIGIDVVLSCPTVNRG